MRILAQKIPIVLQVVCDPGWIEEKNHTGVFQKYYSCSTYVYLPRPITNKLLQSSLICLGAREGITINQFQNTQSQTFEAIMILVSDTD